MPKTMTQPIVAPRVKLVPLDVALGQALQRSRKELGIALQCRLARSWTVFGLPPIMWALKVIQEDPTQAGWLTYFVLHTKTNTLIGTCGYKGKPTPKGRVEIGYEIAPAYRHQGLATEVAQALMVNAFLFPEVREVVAHTLAEENHSVQLLRHLGFTFVETLFDPDDGDIWQWVYPRPA